MITLTESRDLEEMIPGNILCEIAGSDSDGASWDLDEIAQHQEMINTEMEEVYQESRKLFYPDDGGIP